MTSKIFQIFNFNSDRLSYYSRQIINDIVEVVGEDETVEEADRHPRPAYETGFGITPITHQNKPAAIIMGHNKDYQSKSEINMTAGTLGHLVTDNNPSSPDSGKPIKVAHPTPTDAASVIVSAMSNYGDYNARSLVTNKADIVVTKASELVEIRAGGTPYLLANGAKNPNVYGSIHLISGGKTKGKDYELQSMVKGENLVEFFKDLIKFIANTNSQIRELNKDMQNLKKALIKHNHQIIASSPSGPVTGTAIQSTNLASAVAPSITKNVTINTSLSSLEKNYTILKKNYLNSNSPKKIRSLFNKVN